MHIIKIMGCLTLSINLYAQTTEVSKNENNSFSIAQQRPLILLNNKVISYDSLSTIDPKTILLIDVIKSPKADSLYGESGRNGVILVKQKDYRKDGEKE